MSGNLLATFNAVQQFGNNNAVLAGGFLYTYQAGTTAPVATYTDSTLTVPNPNPIVLNSAGRLPNEIWIANNTSIKVMLTDSSNNVLGTYDNIPGINSNPSNLSEWLQGTTPAYVSSTSFTTSGNTVSTFQVNRRIQYTVTSGTYYGTITASSYASGTNLTTVVFLPDSTGMDSSLTGVNYGFMSAVNTSIPNIYANLSAANNWTANQQFNGNVTVSGTTTLGTATATTPAQTSNTTNLATTAFVQTLVANTVASGSPAAAWVAGNTYVKGNVVYSPINFQTYRHITATSSLSTDPSQDGTNWVILGVNNGENTQTISVNLALTSGSVNTQNITASATNLAVQMGVATTYSTVGLAYVIHNSGTNNFDLQDSTGATLFSQLQPGQHVLIWLRDNTTAAGLWAVFASQGSSSALTAGLASAATLASGGVQSICQLSSNTALLCGNTGGNWEVQVAVCTGTVVTVGTAVAINTAAGGPYPIACCMVTTNQAAIVTGDGRLWGVTVSGTVPTIGSSVPFAPASGVTSLGGLSICLVSANTVLISCQNTASTYGLYAVVATVNGLNVNVNGNTNNLTEIAVNNSLCLSNIGVDTILATWQASTSVYGVVFTGVSGLYTPGTVYTLVNAQAQNVSTYPAQSCYIGSNQAMLTYNDNTNSNFATAVVVSISGTTLTVNTKQQIVAAANVSMMCQATTGAAFVIVAANIYGMSVSGTTITVGTGVAHTAAGMGTQGALALVQSNTNKCILAWRSATTTLSAEVISVASNVITVNAAQTLTVTTGTTSASVFMGGCQTGTDQVTLAYTVAASTTTKSFATISSATTTATWGTPVTATVTANIPCAVCLTAASAAFAYVSEIATSTIGGTISAGAITLGSAGNTWNKNPTGVSSVAAAYSSSGRVLYGFVDQTANYVGESYVVAAQVSGTTVTAPVFPTSLGTGSTSYPSTGCAASGTGNAVISYSDTNNYANAIYATVTAATFSVSFGSNLLVYNGAASYNQCVVQTANNAFVVGYQTSSTAYAAVVTASGTTLTAQSPVTLGTAITAASYYWQNQWLTNTGVTNVLFAAFNQVSTAYQGSILNLSGTTLTASALSPYTIAEPSAPTAFSLASVGAGGKMVNFTSSNGYAQAIQYVKT